jgi:hypothetical protein
MYSLVVQGQGRSTPITDGHLVVIVKHSVVGCC